MSVLVVGLSYRTTPLALLERVALAPAQCRALEADLLRREHVAEALVLATCNRLEVYAEVSAFHGGVADVGDAVAAATGVALSGPDGLTDHLYVHYEAAAVAHLFGVASGLDSMAVGEQQILGQVRLALRAAQEAGSLGAGALDGLLQQALRVGKRVHAETGLDHAGRSLVEAGLDAARAVLGPLEDRGALVVGAGAMSALVVATLGRAGCRRVDVANRTPERARQLVAQLAEQHVAAEGTAVPIEDLASALPRADVVLSCTGALGHVITVADAASALRLRGGRPQVYVDLALPRDVEPGLAALAGATVVDLEALGRAMAGSQEHDVAPARALVEGEVTAYLAQRRAQAVAPTVVALRAHAGRLVEAELARLETRLGADVDPRVVAELERTVHRVVDKLLHTPTVRVKQLAAEPAGSSYADALRALFDLDARGVAAVTTPVGAA